MRIESPEPAAQSVILKGVSWDTYDRLLREHEDVSNPRFAYDRGTLQIMVTSFEHEALNRLIARLFETIAEELGIDYVNAGSTTFRSRTTERGFEPDTAFYVRHAAAVRNVRRIDLSRDPPPDLVIEVDITHPSIDKLPIFAGLGIPEVWRFDGRSLVILRLANEDYVAVAASETLPGVKASDLNAHIESAQTSSRGDWVKQVRDWAAALRHA